MSKLPSEAEIKRGWPTNHEPLATICCVTYKHERYISAAIEGFLIQRTNFPFEIIIGEDCSPDDTLKIVRSYEASYPSLIKVVTGPTNVGMNRNNSRVREQASGSYIALCDGDDYWTDPTKLQKEVDFLRHNPTYALCYTASVAHDENGPIPTFPGGLTRDVSSLELIRGCPLNTHTVCFRNLIKDVPPEYFAARTSDIFLWSMLGWHGNGKFLDDIRPSVYRVHSGGVYSRRPTAERPVMSLTTYAALLAYYDRIGKSDIAHYYAERIHRISFGSLWSMQGVRMLLEIASERMWKRAR
jgi:glycosyltransferase involved in cell wall biosynthesis